MSTIAICEIWEERRRDEYVLVSGSFCILYILRIVGWELPWAGRQPNYTVLFGNFNIKGKYEHMNIHVLLSKEMGSDVLLTVDAYCSNIRYN
jgi:hypothetical protein